MRRCDTCGRPADAEVNGVPYCHVGGFPTHYQLALYDEVSAAGETETGLWLRALERQYGQGKG